MGISIRPLLPDDAVEYRKCRLDALLDSPSAFATSFEEESLRPVEFFRDRFEQQSDSDTENFAAFDGDRIVGLTSIIRETRERRRHKMTIVSVFVRPEYRSQKLGRQLMQAAIDHARETDGVTHIELSVEKTNLPAKSLYQSFGFTTWGIEDSFAIIDGASYDEEYMVLRL